MVEAAMRARYILNAFHGIQILFARVRQWEWERKRETEKPFGIECMKWRKVRELTHCTHIRHSSQIMLKILHSILGSSFLLFIPFIRCLRIKRRKSKTREKWASLTRTDAMEMLVGWWMVRGVCVPNYRNVVYGVDIFVSKATTNKTRE